jgi:hypothetical protein
MRPKGYRFGAFGSFALVLVLVAATSTTATELKHASVTQIVKDVEFVPTNAAPRAATLNDKITDGAAIRTGNDSRAELTSDQTVTRSSANTIFRFKEKMRDVDLVDGAVLVRAPKRGQVAKISADAVTAAVAGTTGIMEFHPHSYLKFISLEGTARLYLKNRLGESVLVRPGQMLITNPDAKRLPDPVDVDLARLVETARLLVDFPPLGSQNLIAKEIEKQQRAKSKRALIDTNLVIFGKGTAVTLTNPAQMSEATQSIGSSPATQSDAIPASADLGTIETRPAETSSESSAVGTNSANRAADAP